MKILWQSNGRYAPSGYGNQTGLFVPALKKAGHDPTIFAFYGQQGNPAVDADGIRTLPPAVDAYGNDVIENHMTFSESELLITLLDPFVLAPEVYGTLPWCAWAPIDGTPILPGNVYSLKAAKWIWAMSRFGEAELKRAGFNNVRYVPHGVDTTVFKPIDRVQARERMSKFLGISLAGKFLVAFNGANTGSPPRKGFYEAFAAFKAFSDDHENAVLYMHTERDGRRGVPLLPIMEQVGLSPDKVIFAPQYKYLCGMLPAVYLNDVYNSADVFLHTSHGEGFGIPLIEAQASGCPVIAPNGSAMAELSFSQWLASTTPFMAVPGQLWRIPDIDDLVFYLNRVATSSEQVRSEYREAAREQAMEYDYQRVLKEYMLPAIADMEHEIREQAERSKPVTIPARGQTI